MNYTIEPQQPFGAVIRNSSSNRSLTQFSPQQIRAWVAAHKLIVFRGYDTFEKEALALFGQQLGKPLQWAFGAINDLKVKPNTENYIFTDHDVPMHWDGAFVGTIPHIILFQCIIAPAPEDMGGTTFADTSGILADASLEQLRAWEKISITYTTKKVVHYGGKIRQRFIAAHAVDGRPVIRYAEPVDDLNPVSLDIEGLDGKSPEAFISELRTLLYDPRYLYTHRWEAGDIVLADNHLLLHGREAFRKANERYIQRINILHRPEGFSLMRFLKNSLTIRRKEFFVAELPIFLIPLLLSIGSLQDLQQLSLWLGLLAIILLFNVGDMINCYADYKLDAIFKSHLSNAVYELGKKNVMAQIIGSGILAMALTIVVARMTDQMWLFPLTVAGTFIGLQYSVRPFKFKSRGLLQVICLWGIIFYGPMLYTAIIAGGFPGYLYTGIFALYGFHQMGIILLNTAEDYPEDKATGLRTVVVALGLHRTMHVAFGMVILAGLGLQVCLLLLFRESGLPFYAFLSIIAFTIGWVKIIAEYRVVIRKMQGLDEAAATEVIKKNGMLVPRWLKIGAYTALVPVIVFFIHRLLASS